MPDEFGCISSWWGTLYYKWLVIINWSSIYYENMHTGVIAFGQTINVLVRLEAWSPSPLHVMALQKQNNATYSRWRPQIVYIFYMVKKKTTHGGIRLWISGFTMQFDNLYAQNHHLLPTLHGMCTDIYINCSTVILGKTSRSHLVLVMGMQSADW